MSRNRYRHRTQNTAGALRQLVCEYHEGRLTNSDYRGLRRKLIEAAASDFDGAGPQYPGNTPPAMQPGRRVWAILLLIVAILAMVTWLLR